MIGLWPLAQGTAVLPTQRMPPTTHSPIASFQCFNRSSRADSSHKGVHFRPRALYKWMAPEHSRAQGGFGSRDPPCEKVAGFGWLVRQVCR